MKNIREIEASLYDLKPVKSIYSVSCQYKDDVL